MKLKYHKNTGIVAFLIALSLIIGWLLVPYFIELYFNQQPVYSVLESKTKLYVDNNYYKPNKDAIFLGQSIVLHGYIDEHYVLSDYDSSLKYAEASSTVLVPITDKINCIPNKKGYYKIVGAYNITQSQHTVSLSKELKFYVLWTLGGCK